MPSDEKPLSRNGSTRRYSDQFADRLLRDDRTELPPEGEQGAGPSAHKQWRLVFSDEFEGDKLDGSKWTRSRSTMPAFSWDGGRGVLCEDHADVDGNGHFVIKVTRDEYWSNDQPVPAQVVRRTEGTRVLRVRFDTTPLNFGGLEFTPVSGDASQ